jgi:DNA repair exonuclease SbcCD ATPase subunit
MRSRRSLPSLRPRVLVDATIAAALLGAATASAQSAPQPSSPGIERELAGIRVTLERIVELLDAQERRAEGEVLLRRMELKTTRLVPVEERLRRVQAERAELDGERRHMQNIVKTLEERSFDAETEEQRLQLAEETRQFSVSLQRLDDRREALELEQERLRSEQDQLSAELEQLERELEVLQAREPRSPR